MTDSADDDADRLTVVCSDGTEIGCTNFKAIDSGILLTEDLKKNRVMGFVSHDEVRFVLPTSKVEAAIDTLPEDERSFETPLKQLPGLGSTYAKRLQAAGFDTLDAVGDATPATLSDETGAREEKTQEWVDQADTLASTDGHADGADGKAVETDGQ